MFLFETNTVVDFVYSRATKIWTEAEQRVTASLADAVAQFVKTE